MSELDDTTGRPNPLETAAASSTSRSAGGVFISYRRDDGGPYAGRLADHLGNHFGPELVFRDVDSIEPGKRFRVVIADALAVCDALLAVIGPHWLTVSGRDGRCRLEDPEDLVRREIAAALDREDVVVIPVLVGGATMPRPDELPDPLALLADHNALRLADDTWEDQVARLIRVLEPVVRPGARHEAAGRPGLPGSRQTAIVNRPLPTFTTSLVGRDGDIERGRELLARSALLTVTGVGGVGKTRIAVELAQLVAPEHDHGVCYVELAPVASGAHVGQAAATAVGVVETPGSDLIHSIEAALRDRRLLLLLDNCEHVVAEVGRLCEQLLRTCPGLRILATSRRPLGIEAETVWPLRPLPVPVATPVSVEELRRVPSVRLFLDRAATSGSEFVLDDGTAPAVAELCRRLDGIPLAIQLVVARLRVMSVEDLAARVGNWLRSGAPSDDPQSRQRTMYAAVDWSYRLLSVDGRATLIRLAAFSGGCALDAAEQVCALNQAGEAVLELLSELVDSSMVVAENREGVSRFRLLEPVREFALERLEESGEGPSVRTAHAVWYAALAARAAEGIGGREASRWLAALDRDEANIRAALRFLLEEDPVAGLRLATAMEPYWFHRSRVTEGQAWLQHALAAADAPPPDRVRALVSWSSLLRANDQQAALDRAAEAVDLAKKIGDPALIAPALLVLAQALWWGLMRATEARKAYDDCLVHARRAGDAQVEATALSGLADMLVESADIRAAIAAQTAAMALADASGDPWEAAMARANLGYMHNLEGEFSKGIDLLDDAMARVSSMSSPWAEGWIRCAIAEPAFAQGRLDEAEHSYRRALEALNKASFEDLSGWALSGLGFVALARSDIVAARAHFTDMVRRRVKVYGAVAEAAPTVVPQLAALYAAEGRHALAARLLGGAAAARTRLAFPALYLKDRAAMERATETVRRALGDAAFEEAYETGAATPMTELVVQALDALGMPTVR